VLAIASSDTKFSI
jgi:hypothetical protein